MRKYTVELTKNQLKLIWKALESFERVRMGQFNDLADDIAFANYVYDKNIPGNTDDFNTRILRRNKSEDLFNVAFFAARPVSTNKTEEMLIAEDMWMQIRSELNMDEWRKPLWNGKEPPMKISEV